ncbi:hypothetical protein MASR2M117_03700 [Paludibacter sp.]
MCKNRIIILLIIVFLSSLLTIYSQEKNIQNKFILKTGFSMIPVLPEFYNPFLKNEGYKTNRPNFTLEFNYRLLRNIDLGVDLGYSQLLAPYKQPGMISYGYEKTNAFFYGINTSIHILPMILKQDNSTFDAYIIAKAGVVTQSWRGVFDSGEMQYANCFEYSIGVGIAYNFTKKVALFGEYHIGNFINKDFSKIKTGIRFSF